MRRRGPLFWWDVAAAALLLFQAVVGVFEGFGDAPAWAAAAPPQVRVVLALLPLVLFGALYAGLGRRSLLRGLRDERLGRLDLVFLGLLVGVLGFAVFCVPMHAVLQALVYPVIWTVVARYRDAVLWNLAVALVLSAAMFLGLHLGGVSRALASAAITGPLSFVFAVIMGTWISRIFAQGEEYRLLAEQLRESQAEVAALSEATGAAAERERLSRELHDTLTQTLAGLVMLSEQAERAIDADEHAHAKDRLERVGSAAREALAEARALVATTQPLGDGGLEAAIERVAARLRADTGMRVECSLARLSLDRERQVVLLRATQEGLANARKHARASKVVVTLEPLPDRGAVLRVEDDGAGPGADCDLERARLDGFGLSGLADRVRQVGGEVHFGPGEQGGAILVVRLGKESV